jgi:hypothetical protein
MACTAAQTGRVPRGAPETVMQVPGLLGSLQAWHWPLHALEQQTPSIQYALVHSMPLEHETPLAFVGWQEAVASQYLPLPQGMPALQPPEHLLPSAHRFDEHGNVVGFVHAPAPLQLLAEVNMPFAQLLPGHCFPQVPQFAESAARFLQAPLQLVWPPAQQTPAVQFPLWHCAAFWQDAPFATWGTQAPPLQYVPLLQAVVVVAEQDPPPLQVDALATLPLPLHVAGVQTVVLPG